MIPVLILLLAVLCLLVGLAAGLHLTAASKWRLLRDFLYLLVVFVVAAGLAIPSYILWQPAPPPPELVPAAKGGMWRRPSASFGSWAGPGSATETGGSRPKRRELPALHAGREKGSWAASGELRSRRCCL